jgi:hypothetical protein
MTAMMITLSTSSTAAQHNQLSSSSFLKMKMLYTSLYGKHHTQTPIVHFCNFKWSSSSNPKHHPPVRHESSTTTMAIIRPSNQSVFGSTQHHGTGITLFYHDVVLVALECDDSFRDGLEVVLFPMPEAACPWVAHGYLLLFSCYSNFARTVLSIK